jgi:N-acetylglutamate synthase-like GNAT family acetyltransferase
MSIEPIIIGDLTEISYLQPADWPDIVPNIKFYIESLFCKPIKVLIDNKIVGIGSSIEYENTAWIAHIIVHNDYRKRGIGAAIVGHLIKNINKIQCSSVFLIATALGEPVYIKAGFRKVTDYVFLKKTGIFKQKICSENIVSFDNKYHDSILQLDKQVTGENRSRLIETHLKYSKLYIANSHLFGFNLPTLGEGPIIAENSEVGLSLMHIKCTDFEKVVLPVENTKGIDFLKQNGFIETIKCSRMILGKDISWQPEKIFSRIGGNFG